MQVGRYYKVNRPDWYQDAAFLAWLNHPNTATWHTKGQWPNEYSDAFLLYSDSGDANPCGLEIPRRMFEQLRLDLGPMETLVWITNLTETVREEFYPDTTYLLTPELAKYYTEDSEDGRVYRYARTTKYGGGRLTDVWIMSEDDRIHPGYDCDPVPLRWEDVVRPPEPYSS